MPPISYARHQFPPEVIQHAVWLYLRFTLSFRGVEDLLAERGLEVSYETVRRWVLKFGPAIARRLRQGRAKPTEHWQLDETAVRIAGEQMYLWRAVDDEGEVLDVMVQRRRDKAPALKLMRKLLKKQGFGRRRSPPTGCGPTAQPSLNWASRRGTIRACGGTTGPRSRTRRCGGENGRCSASSRPAPPSVSCPCTPRPTTLSTSSVI